MVSVGGNTSVGKAELLSPGEEVKGTCRACSDEDIGVAEKVNGGIMGVSEMCVDVATVARDTEVIDVKDRTCEVLTVEISIWEMIEVEAEGWLVVDFAVDVDPGLLVVVSVPVAVLVDEAVMLLLVDFSVTIVVVGDAEPTPIEAGAVTTTIQLEEVTKLAIVVPVTVLRGIMK